MKPALHLAAANAAPVTLSLPDAARAAESTWREFHCSAPGDIGRLEAWLAAQRRYYRALAEHEGRAWLRVAGGEW